MTINEYTIPNKVKFFELEEDHPIFCSYHQVSNTNKLFIIIPGVDGSHIGYKNKYVTMANNIIQKYKISVLRTSNPYISGVHWDVNFENLMQHVSDKYNHYNEICIFGFSAGASIAVKHAWKYKKIKKLCLVSMAKELQPQNIIDGLKNFDGVVHIHFGKNDPNHSFLEENKVFLNSRAYKYFLYEECDHFFSGKHLDRFLALPDVLLTS